MIYDAFRRNYVILPGREQSLEEFLRQDFGELKGHKWRNRSNSNSEDALTWSCFQLISSLPLGKKLRVLGEIWEDAYYNRLPFPIDMNKLNDNQIKICIGKRYQGSTTKELTEVDASIELPGILIFIEAKLYSPLSLPEIPRKPYDQIARKIRIGLDDPKGDGGGPIFDGPYDFYFIFLDIAPLDKLNQRKSKKEASEQSKGFNDKWKSAWWFDYYKNGRNGSLRPLKSVLEGITEKRVDQIAKNMGWLTWTDLFKDLLRGLIKEE